jgi:hypothetical protein
MNARTSAVEQVHSRAVVEEVPDDDGVVLQTMPLWPTRLVDFLS